MNGKKDFNAYDDRIKLVPLLSNEAEEATTALIMETSSR